MNKKTQNNGSNKSRGNKQHYGNPQIKFIPNAYGLKIRMVPASVLGMAGEYSYLNGKKTYDRLPFVIVKRGYMKTVANFINDFFEMNYWFIDSDKDSIRTRDDIINDISKKYIIGDEFNDTVDWLVPYREFVDIMNGKNVQPKFKDTQDIVRSYDIHGNAIIWAPSNDNTRYEMDNTYAAISIYTINQIQKLVNRIEKFSPSGNTNHQIAAFNYMNAVIRSINKSIFIIE